MSPFPLVTLVEHLNMEFMDSLSSIVFFISMQQVSIHTYWRPETDFLDMAAAPNELAWPSPEHRSGPTSISDTSSASAPQ